MKNSSSGRVIFYRHLVAADAGTNGGNLKLRDCFEHFRTSNGWKPVIYFSPQTVWPPERVDLWSDLREEALGELAPRPGDLLFFSGRDWRVLPPALRKQPPVPVLNIVQPRHARKGDPRKEYLRHPALRIAKSAVGAGILRGHGVNGPLFTIPDTIDLAALPPIPEKDIDVLIPGIKQPDFARQVAERLRAQTREEFPDLRIHLQLPPKLPTRADFLSLLARTRIVACVPLDLERGGEGFYLPALEAMALRTLVVCPHAIGNVEHCRHEQNCLVPEFTVSAVVNMVVRALHMTPAERERLLTDASRTAARHDITAERRAVLALADRAYELWANEDLFLPSPPPRRKSAWLARLRAWSRL